MTNNERIARRNILWNLLGAHGADCLQHETDDDYVVAAWENWLNLAHELECGSPLTSAH